MEQEDMSHVDVCRREQKPNLSSQKPRIEWSTSHMLKRGFTLIELLVVIAIIAILAAIIFPVFARVKDSAYRSSDMSNMNALRSALQLYRQDQGGYPPALLGYVTQYNGGPNPVLNDMIPANQVAGALFPKRVDSLETFRPAYDRGNGSSQQTQFTTAVWPNKGGMDSLYPNASGVQKYGPADGNVQRCFNPGGGATPYVVNNFYYSISGYDVATVPNENGSGFRTEIHYSPFWTTKTVPDIAAAGSACNLSGFNGASDDNPRQLGYLEPPETTVVTWNSFFRDYDAGAVAHTKKDMVLFLGGSAKPYDSSAVAVASWLVTP